MADCLISAIICTHNRDQYLGAAIDSLLNQTLTGVYEVIVIDNASTDTTAEVVKARLAHPKLKYIYESTLGLSVARNTGANHACGSILAYLDDDAEASPQWLQSLYDIYQTNTDVVIAGGKVTLLWPPGVKPPTWLSDELASGLGAYDLGSEVQYIHNPNLTPRGLNYSIRKTFLEAVGGFDTNLGRVGKNLLSNEELHMTQLALAEGKQIAYVPEALAAHNVAPARLKPMWFLSRSWWQGISECYREQVSGNAGVDQLRRGGERLVRGLYKTLKYFPDPAQRFENFAYAYGQVGYLGSVLQYLVRSK
jgi:glycosyltransferase involved in cell wall biosynthesis